MGSRLDLRVFAMDDREVVKAKLNSDVYELEFAKGKNAPFGGL